MKRKVKTKVKWIQNNRWRRRKISKSFGESDNKRV